VVQPKAAGSSLLYSLTNKLVLHAIKVSGITRAAAALVLPLATGMALALTLTAVRATRPPGAKYVIWPRIDQRSCFKCMLTAGLTPIVVENVLEGDELRTDVAGIAAAIDGAGGPAAVVAVMTTASCFAPRGTDNVVDVAKLCAARGIPHVINNAYGLQASGICHQINEAVRLGRVDAFVQSSDKNFMVGGVVACARLMCVCVCVCVCVCTCDADVGCTPFVRMCWNVSCAFFFLRRDPDTRPLVALFSCCCRCCC
jgi:O-phospho-L-seryl-tRNASec:L-selenocysteinyl-tRNA synthase